MLPKEQFRVRGFLQTRFSAKQKCATKTELDQYGLMNYVLLLSFPLLHEFAEHDPLHIGFALEDVLALHTRWVKNTGYSRRPQDPDLMTSFNRVGYPTKVAFLRAR